MLWANKLKPKFIRKIYYAWHFSLWCRTMCHILNLQSLLCDTKLLSVEYFFYFLLHLMHGCGVAIDRSLLCCFWLHLVFWFSLEDLSNVEVYSHEMFFMYKQYLKTGNSMFWKPRNRRPSLTTSEGCVIFHFISLSLIVNW